MPPASPPVESNSSSGVEGSESIVVTQWPLASDRLLRGFEIPAGLVRSNLSQFGSAGGIDQRETLCPIGDSEETRIKTVSGLPQLKAATAQHQHGIATLRPFQSHENLLSRISLNGHSRFQQFPVFGSGGEAEHQKQEHQNSLHQTAPPEAATTRFRPSFLAR